MDFRLTCVLTNFSELVMLFEMAKICRIPVQQNPPVALMKRTTISRIFALLSLNSIENPICNAQFMLAISNNILAIQKNSSKRTCQSKIHLTLL